MIASELSELEINSLLEFNLTNALPFRFTDTDAINYNLGRDGTLTAQPLACRPGSAMLKLILQ